MFCKPKLWHHVMLGACLCVVSIQANSSGIYQWKDSNGKVHFTDYPPQDKTYINVSSKIQQSQINKFSKYCSGKLLTELPLLSRDENGWVKSNKTAPIGTTVYLHPFMSSFWGYVINQDGTANLIKDLTLNQQIKSECAKDSWLSMSTPHEEPVEVDVFLSTSTMYPDKELRKSSCTIQQGTILSSSNGYLAMPGNGQPSQFDSDVLKEKCGFSLGFSKDAVLTSLIPLSK